LPFGFSNENTILLLNIISLFDENLFLRRVSRKS
jgi:hypothetical protein